MDGAPSFSVKHATAWGVLCGAGSALCWAVGFVAARQGINVGLSPLVLALHRYIWPGLFLLPVIAAGGFRDLGGIGWRRGFALTCFGGLPLGLVSYTGYVLVPLGHGALIQPACAALGGMLLAWLVLKEPLPPRRIAGGLAIIIGLAVIGAEALRTIGAGGIVGDLLFVTAGCFFAVFGMLLRLWRIASTRAVAATCVLSLVSLPALLFCYGNFLAAGFLENLLQAVVQGALAGAGGTYLFARAVELLGASRAVLFPSLVPAFTLLIGYLTLGEVPSVPQLIGLVIVAVGFQLTQKG